MKKPIIPIERASEATVKALVRMGVLEVTEDGVRVAEKPAEKRREAEG